MAIVRFELKDNPIIRIGARVWLYRHARWQRLNPPVTVHIDYGVPTTTNVVGYNGATFTWTSH